MVVVTLKTTDFSRGSNDKAKTPAWEELTILPQTFMKYLRFKPSLVNCHLRLLVFEYKISEQ